MVRSFADMYLQTVQTASESFAEIVRINIEKAKGRFLEPDVDSLPDFDATFPKEERLPDTFEIVFTQRKNAQSYSCLSMKLSKAAETQRMSHRGFQSLCHIRVRTVQLPPTSL